MAWTPRMFAGLPLIPCCGRCGRIVWGEDPAYDEKGRVRHPGPCPEPRPQAPARGQMALDLGGGR